MGMRTNMASFTLSIRIPSNEMVGELSTGEIQGDFGLTVSLGATASPGGLEKKISQSTVPSRFRSIES
jgi:hypothetical protein